MSSTTDTTHVTRRQTLQRHAIVGALEAAAGPLTPQEILEAAGREHPGLGLATVYRNLGVMQESGDVCTVHLPGEPTRFELTEGRHHHHFRCEDCHGVFAIEQPCPVQVLEGVTLPGGFKVRDHALTFYGTCPDCLTGGDSPGPGTHLAAHG